MIVSSIVAFVSIVDLLFTLDILDDLKVSMQKLFTSLARTTLYYTFTYLDHN